MLLIDGDIYCYRVACACETDAQANFSTALAQARRALDSLIADTLVFYPDHNYIFYLTGKGNALMSAMESHVGDAFYLNTL